MRTEQDFALIILNLAHSSIYDIRSKLHRHVTKAISSASTTFAASQQHWLESNSTKESVYDKTLSSVYFEFLGIINCWSIDSK